MAFEIDRFAGELMLTQAKKELLDINATSARFGLTLSENDAEEIAKVRKKALRENGRVEFAGGVLASIAYAFCDSPYISQKDYKNVIERLTELFYYYKNETGDRISDERLIKFMAGKFNGECNGTLELLEKELYRVAYREKE